MNDNKKNFMETCRHLSTLKDMEGTKKDEITIITNELANVR